MKRALLGLALVAGFLACRQMLTTGWNDGTLTLDDAGTSAVTEEAGLTVVVGQDGKPVYLPVSLGGDSLSKYTQITLSPVVQDGGPDAGVPTGLTADLILDGGPVIAVVANATPAQSGVHLALQAFNPDTQAISEKQSVLLDVAVVATVTPTVTGNWKEFVSTSLQPASFQQHIPDVASLMALTHHHPVHVQIYDSLWNGPSEDAAVWDSGRLDSFVTQLVDAGQEVQLEIFTPPQLDNHIKVGSGYQYDDPDALASYAAYCAAIVAHFNGDGGVPGILPPGEGVRWWSIRGDDNTNSPPPDYVTPYNTAIAAMLKVDSTIQFIGPEASDQVNNGSTTQAGTELYPGYLIPFVNAPDAGGAAQIDAIAVHMYSASLPTTADQQVLSTIPTFALHIGAIRQDLVGPLQNLPIWVTQTNVNSAVPITAADGGIVFHDNTDTPFAPDQRGTKTFFAAWEPYMFSQLGQAGNTGFFHWAYTAGHNADDSGANLDPQNAEVHYDPDNAGVYEKYVSYWVDYELSLMFPPDGQNVLYVPAHDPSVDVLATQNQDGSFTVMVTDIAPENDTIPDGLGLPRTVLVDLHLVIPSCDQVKATVTTIDSLDHLDSAPVASTAFPPQPGCRFPVVLRGYGVAFLNVPAARSDD